MMDDTANSASVARLLRRFFICAAAVMMGVFASTAPALSADPSARAKGAAEMGVRFIPLGIGKSYVVDLPRDAKDVLVADPKIANAVVRSARRAFLIGMSVGQTNVFFFDAEGRQIAGFDIAVTRDLNGVRAAMRQILPHATIRVEGVGPEAVLLTGAVKSPEEAQRAVDLATKLVGDATKVVNNITVEGRDQVMLKVTVAEVQRDVIKQFGVNLNGSVGIGSSVIGFNTTNPFSMNQGPINDPSRIFGDFVTGGTSINATLRAMERAGVMRTLAEPNLTAISGEAANFLAGGEFPVVGGLSCDTSTQPPTCTRSVQYKKFGVSLSFTPVVLAEGRISLRVLTEVSELTSEGAVTLGIGSDQVIIPSLRVRRADTTVEIPSGGALAMAGMIQEQTKQAMNGLPGLQQVPILGALFRSRDYINRQTELMVIVTPYIVRATKPSQLSRPDDGFADPADPSAVLLGRLNKVYGPGTRDPRRPYHGSYGFILD